MLTADIVLLLEPTSDVPVIIPATHNVITGASLVDLVLRDSGAFGTGQTPNGQDVADCKFRLNMMLGSWQQRRWLQYRLADTAFICDNSLNYSVGPGGDFNVPRPSQIKAAYVRQLIPANPYNVDFWLQPIFSREDYSQITLKNLQAGPPTHFFYDADYPQGFVYPWPLCNFQYELHILTVQPLAYTDSLSSDIQLPDEYQAALYWNMLVETRNAYDLPTRAVDVQKAKATLNTLRLANGTQIPSLKMPRTLRTPRAYNPYSDSP